MTAPEFCRRIAALGYSQRGFAAYVGANERTVRRWALDEQDIPPWVAVILGLLEAVRAQQPHNAMREHEQKQQW